MHSAPIAEVAAHICGLAVGVGVYVAAGWVTPDIHTRIRTGMIASSITNAIVGGHINLLARDIFSLIILRPISAYAGAKLFEALGQAISAHSVAAAAH